MPPSRPRKAMGRAKKPSDAVLHMTVASLKQRLKSHRLPTTGAKQTLVNRLRSHLAQRDRQRDQSQEQPTEGNDRQRDRSPRDRRQRTRQQANREAQQLQHGERPRSRSAFTQRSRGSSSSSNQLPRQRRRSARHRHSHRQKSPRKRRRLPTRTRGRKRRSRSRSNTARDSSNSSSSSSRSSRSSSSSSSSSSGSSSSSATSRSHSHHRRNRKSKRKSTKSKGKARHSRKQHPTVTGCPPPSRKLVDKIRKGEYVPFHKLLLPPGHPYPLETNKSRRKQPKRVVNSLSLWLEAWNRFAGVLIAHKPEKALELAQYQTLLCMAFEHYPHKACVEYDSCFRQKASKDKQLRWDKYKEDIFVWCFSPKPASSAQGPHASAWEPRHSFRPRSILSRLGPAAADQASHTATGDEICIRFNLPRGCTRGAGCKYKHVCNQKNCGGEHSASKCNKQRLNPS